MTPHEALTRALMMLTQEAPLRRAVIGDAEDQDALRDDVIDELANLILMFEPFEGDPVDEAMKRVPHPCKCAKCGLLFPRFWLPAPVDRVARQAIRGAFCPRCGSTEGINVFWDDAKNCIPKSVKAKVITVEEYAVPFDFNKRKQIDVILQITGLHQKDNETYDALKKQKAVTITMSPGFD